MTSDVLAETAGRLPAGAIDLARHAAVPVAIDARLLNLLRVNFFLDPPATLPYEMETALLLSPLFREIGDGLYEIDPASRTTLLGELVERFGRERLGRVAGLLEQYTDRTSAWHTQPELENAQRLTALNLLDPARADEWLQREKAASAGVGTTLSHSWFVAMETRLRQQQIALEPVPSEMAAVLSVTVTPSRADPDRCVVEGWYRSEGGAESRSLGFRETPNTELMTTIGDVVEQAAGQVTGASAPIVEIILPRALLDLPIEMASPSDDPGMPLGAKFPMVLRSSERVDERSQRLEWLNRWTALQEGHPKALSVSALSDADRLATQLDVDRVTTVVLSSPPTSDRGHSELSVALFSGVPVILWDRRPTTDAATTELLRQLASARSAELPHLVQRLRRDASAAIGTDHPGRHIALLWDDPTALPPEAVPTSAAPGSTGDGPEWAILTALPVEARAVRAILHDAREFSAREDPNRYLLGALPSSMLDRPHKVVLTTATRDGTRSSAALIADLRRTFPSLRAIISCGIASGVRTRETERIVRLGDVVFADSLVDYSRRRADDRSVRTIYPSATFRLANQELRMLGSTGQQPWLDVLRSRGSPSNFARPGNSLDEPVIHRAAIAYGDIALGNSRQLEALARNHGVLAIDMEGAGLAESLLDVPWFLVRGVADYADQPSEVSAWRSYAALTAAAYVQALLAKCAPGPTIVRRPDVPEYQSSSTLGIGDEAEAQATGEYLTRAEVEGLTGAELSFGSEEADELPDDEGQPEINDDEAAQTGLDEG